MNLLQISYAITVCNEHQELDRLLTLLLEHIREVDEVVVQFDEGNTTTEVLHVLDKHSARIRVVQFPLKGNFASFKNNLKKNCKGSWIFQIDADEYPTIELIQGLPEILAQNPTVELFLVPRINTVEGLTQEHIRRWRWHVNENGWVNFPDAQTRILQNSPKINWASKVHEVITGHSSYAMLPPTEEYCLIHPKTIARQITQNNFYNGL